MARRRRAQRARAECRHAQWLIGLVQATQSHHTAATGKGSLEARVAVLEKLVAELAAGSTPSPTTTRTEVQQEEAERVESGDDDEESSDGSDGEGSDEDEESDVESEDGSSGSDDASEISFSEVHQRIEQDPKQLVMCPMGCGQKGEVGKLALHLRAQCSKRTETRAAAAANALSASAAVPPQPVKQTPTLCKQTPPPSASSAVNAGSASSASANDVSNKRASQPASPTEVTNGGRRPAAEAEMVAGRRCKRQRQRRGRNG